MSQTKTTEARLLGELRPAYAEVLRAIDVDGNDPADVAVALGITVGNLQVRLHRARRLLRERVSSHCGVDSIHACLDCTCDTGRCCSGEPRPSSKKENAFMPAPEKLSRDYLAAFYRGDVATARRLLADQVTFVGPSARVQGADSFLKMAGHVAPGVRAVDVHRVFVDGDETAIFYDLLLDHRVGRVSVAERHRVRDGKIAAIELLLDTAPFMRRASDEPLAVDPICGMQVAPSTAAATRERGGTTLYFCSKGCAEAFDKSH